jgi:hypothetical protein
MEPEKDKGQDDQRNVKMNKSFIEGMADSRRGLDKNSE